MAPNPKDQKRKRGRPPGASKPTEDASSRERPEDNDDVAEEESRPQKRGRKTLKDNAVSNSDHQEPNEPAQHGRRGRPPKSKTHVPEADINADPVNSQSKNPKPNTGETSSIKSKSVKGKAKASEPRVDEEPPSSEPRRSGRERRPNNPEELYSARRPNTSPTQFTSPPSDSSRMPPPTQRTKKSAPEPTSSTPRRSGRERRVWDAEKLFSASRKSVEQQEEASSGTPKVTEKAKGKTTGNAPRNAIDLKGQALKATAQNAATGQKRPSRMPRNESPGEGPSRSRNGKATQAVEHTETPKTDPAQPKRRGRPKKSDPTSPESGPPSKSHKGPSQAQNMQDKTQGPAKSKRKPPPARREPELDEENSSESEEEEDIVPFRYLKETTRNIQRSTISDKWTPLDPLSIDAVSNILADAQRPVLLRLENTSQRRGYASSALGVVIRRLRSSLVKGVPFPAPTVASSTRSNAATYEDDFDYERIVDAVQTLENTLNPLLHSVSLLAREISKEEDVLARDYDSLHRLETNAKAEAKEWRDKTRREHVLAPGVKRKGEQEDESRDRLELVPAAQDGVSGGLFKDLEDEELVTLSKQIGSHMESMKGNLQPIDGVLPAITKSKAALQQVLLKHLGDEQYESVLLG